MSYYHYTLRKTDKEPPAYNYVFAAMIPSFPVVSRTQQFPRVHG
jgi:hypothetical protein